jgi:tRNA-specific adenosine deaminase 1
VYPWRKLLHPNCVEATLILSRTGSKCLPVSAISKCDGMVLHDSHAEVLALRALNRFLLSEVLAVLQKGLVQYVSPFISFRAIEVNQRPEQLCPRQPFEIRGNVSIWMFSTEAPCGDASMEVLMAEKEGDVEPWDRNLDCKDVLQGRGYFSALGTVRRKPSRRDAETTMSKSCTDKLTLCQVTSILSSPANLIIASTESAYLSGLIVPSTSYSEKGFRRAFGLSGRLASIQISQLPSCVQFHPFKTTVLPSGFNAFPFSKTDAAQGPLKAGNVSAVFVKNLQKSNSDVDETILGGVKQGHRPFANDPKKASVVCRLRLWELVRSIIDYVQEEESVPVETRHELLHANAWMTYGELKASDLNAHRRAAKEIATQSLGKWPKNSGDESWSLQPVTRENGN